MKTKEIKQYWYCPLDQYGQTDGHIREIKMTEEQYNKCKANIFSDFYYIYDNKIDAIKRTQY